MKPHIKERVLEAANHMVANNCTLRGAAEVLGVSKSTVHLDISERLQHVDPDLYSKARVIININLEERASRGGAAFKRRLENEDK